ncbi:hypothetical protein [Pseudomonas sp. HY7a-MNA-CIBAN-0227]|uniref:hypothetical protein n=1 Tax=Pseudomonas sp. HY7a-MNA-CIBAN-0227 TaxID=3140474 RepID=UPI0033305E1B
MPMNEMARILGQSAQTTSGRQGFQTRSGMGYQAARIAKPDGPDYSLADSLRNFVKAGGDAFNSYDQSMTSQGAGRANEIIRKLSPEDRRSAREDGTLLYQDDPYTMKALRELTGRSAAHELDQEVQTWVSEGGPKTRKELDDFVQDRREKGGKAFAEMDGLDYDHEDFQRGFNDSVSQRNAALVDTFGRRQSEEHKVNAALRFQGDLSALVSDPAFMRSPEAAQVVAGTIANGLRTGVLAGTAEARKALGGFLQDSTARDGGVALLSAIGEQKIPDSGGEMIAVNDWLGRDHVENLQATAAKSEQTMKTARVEKFHGQLTAALNHPDVNTGLAMLEQQLVQTKRDTPTDVMTPEIQTLMGKQEVLQNRRRQATAQLNVETVKNQQFQVQVQQIRRQYARKLDGEMVSTDSRLLPTTTETGTWRHEEAETYAANLELSDIERMGLPPRDKTNLVLQYVKGDRKDGPFRKIMNEWGDQAEEQLQGLIASGDTQRFYPALDRFRELVKADPSGMAMLYPERAGIAATLNALDSQGTDGMSLFVTNAQMDAKLPPEARAAQNKQFSTTIRESQSAMQYMPDSMHAIALMVYKGHFAATGSADGAKAATQKWIADNTVVFKAYGGSQSGTVFKSEMLMDPGDVTSWKAGSEALTAELAADDAAHPEYGGKGSFIVSHNGQLFIRNLNGRVKPLHMQDIRDENARKVAQERADAKQREQEKIKRAQEGMGFSSDYEDTERKIREYQADKPK